MTTPRIDEMVEEFQKIHGKSYLDDWLHKALTEAHQAGMEEAVKKIRNEVGGFIAGVYALKFDDNSREAKFWDVWKDGYEQCRKDALNAIEYESRRQN